MAVWSSRGVTEDTLTLKHASSVYIWKTVVLQRHPLYPGYSHSCFLCLDYVRNDARNFPSSHVVKGMWNQMSPACIKVSVGHALLWAMSCCGPCPTGSLLSTLILSIKFDDFQPLLRCYFCSSLSSICRSRWTGWFHPTDNRGFALFCIHFRLCLADCTISFDLFHGSLILYPANPS